MRVRGLGMVIVALLVAAALRAEEAGSFMIKLTHAYDAAWDRGDIPAMVAMLDPECVFRSPFQTRLGREAIKENVFRNVKRFRDTMSVETAAKIEDDLAYSFQDSTFNDYGKDGGNVVKARRVVKHLFIFTKRPGQDWKIRSMFTFDEMEFAPELPVAK
ncbi:MAG: nuclear transport factor 2 family protein [Opitutus sp.]